MITGLPGKCMLLGQKLSARPRHCAILIRGSPNISDPWPSLLLKRHFHEVHQMVPNLPSSTAQLKQAGKLPQQARLSRGVSVLDCALLSCTPIIGVCSAPSQGCNEALVMHLLWQTPELPLKAQRQASCPAQLNVNNGNGIPITMMASPGK